MEAYKHLRRRHSRYSATDVWLAREHRREVPCPGLGDRVSEKDDAVLVRPGRAELRILLAILREIRPVVLQCILSHSLLSLLFEVPIVAGTIVDNPPIRRTNLAEYQRDVGHTRSVRSVVGALPCQSLEMIDQHEIGRQDPHSPIESLDLCLPE